YLFHRVEERLDGSPAIIVVDEGWKALDDEVFVRRIKDWEKTIRKLNGIVGFATQSAQDALESRIASAIVEQAATQIFMVNARARAEDYVQGFGLTPHEFDLIRTLPDSAHCFLIKRGGESVVARLDLSGEKDILTVLSGRERTVRLHGALAGAGVPMASCPRLSTGDAFLSTLLRHIDCQAQAIGTGGYQALADPASPTIQVVTALLTIFVALFGLAMMMGRTPTV